MSDNSNNVPTVDPVQIAANAAAENAGIKSPSEISSGDPEKTPEAQNLEMRVDALEALVKHLFDNYYRGVDKEQIFAEYMQAKKSRLED